MKKFLCLVLALMLIAGISLPAMAYELPDVIPAINADTIVEAESLTPYGTNMKIINEAEASGGKILYPNGTNQQNVPDADKVPMLIFNVYSPMDLTGCKLMIKYAVAGGSTGFFYRLPGQTAWTVKYPAKTSDAKPYNYVWFEVCTVNLKKGNNLIEFAMRNANIRLDQIQVKTSASRPYAASTITSDFVYPQPMEANRLNNVPAFEDGDNVVFIGDSITHGSASGQYLAYLSTYYNSRFPEKEIRYVNKAIGGNDASESLRRFNYDIYSGYDEPFNKAVILLGTNDAGTANYTLGTEQRTGVVTRRKADLEMYRNNIKSLISKLKAKGVEQIILISPPIYDDARTPLTGSYSKGFTNVARSAAAIQYAIAEEDEDVYFIDMNTPMLIADMYNKEKQGTTFNFIPDRTHPNDIGNWIIAYAILKAQGMDGDLANVTIDASEGTAATTRATVSNLSASSNSVSYKYSPMALPLGTDATYRSGDELVPITNELNREIIKVTGLNDGIYDIKMNGNLVMRASADDLANGVNIADKENNPAMTKALKALGYARARIDTDSEYRTHQYAALNLLSSYQGLDTSSNEAFVASIRAYIDSSTNASTITKLNNFLTEKEKEPDWVETSKTLEDLVIANCVPVESNVEISLSSDQSDVELPAYDYIDYQLPQDTVIIIPENKAPGITVDRVVFKDDEGNELTSLPQSGTVTATATVRNNTLEDVEAVVWVASYADIALDSTEFSQKVILAPNEEKEVSASITLNTASTLLKAGVWNPEDGITPLMASATFPAEEVTVKAVYVGDKELNFNPEVTNYNYVVSLEEVSAPIVDVVTDHIGADIELKQATSLKDSATFKVNGKKYSVSFKVSRPYVNAIKVNGVKIENFSPEAFYYELPTSMMGTVEVEADYGVDAEITQPTSSNKEAVIVTEAYYGESIKYTVKFADRDIGEVYDIKWKGVTAPAAGKNNGVAAAPSTAENIRGSYFEDGLNYEEIRQNLIADRAYEDLSGAVYSNTTRSPANMWSTVRSNYYGYNLVFVYANVGSSFLMNPNVTKITKSDVDYAAGADPTKVYEFKLTKPATVYITAASQSTYIPSLNKGWTYEFNTDKYALYRPAYVDTAMDDGKMIRIPTGSTVLSDVAQGHAYYKHFEAGENIEIPAHAASASSRKLGIFIVWDEVQ